MKSIIQRYKNWLDDYQMKRNRLYYKFTYPIADYVADETDYSSYLRKGGVSTTSRVYVSHIIIRAIVIFLTIFFLSYTFLIPDSWISFIVETANSMLIFTNVALVFGGLLDFILNTVTEALQITGDLGGGLSEENIRRIIENNNLEFLGPILLPFAAAYNELIVPIAEELNLLISQNSGSSEINIFEQISQTVFAQFPPVNTLQRITAFIIAPIAGIGHIAYKLYYPIYQSGEIGRQIESELPRSYTFMYALSESGLDTYEVMVAIANSEDAYGEVSRAFQKIVRNANRGEINLSKAILKLANETASDDLEEFLTGLVSAIETGSNVTKYFETAAKSAHKESRNQQANRLEFYELISEAYIILFVAAPIFFIILQLVSGITGAVNRGQSQIIPYMGIPAGGFIIAFVLRLTDTNSGSKLTQLDKPFESKWVDIRDRANVKNEYTTKSHRINESIKQFKKQLRAPIKQIRYKPIYSLFFTFPVVLIYLIASIQLGIVQFDIETLDQNYFSMTMFGYVVPFFIMTVPWSILYELKRRKRDKVIKQLPQLFESIAESNRRGLTLLESLESTADSGDSNLYVELKKSIKKSKVTNSLQRGLVDFANAVRVTRLTQSMRLLIQANNVSTNITIVVDTIAEDLQSLYDLKRERTQRARQFVAILIVSFSISVGVLLALDGVFFEFITEQVEGGGSENSNQPGYATDLPVEFFRRIFLHTLLSLALVSGFVAGMMENGDLQNGLKYTILMTTITIVGSLLI